MRGRNKAAPKAIKIKAPKLDLVGLHYAYDWTAVDKSLGLRLAMSWYAKNINALLFGNPLGADRQKTFDKAAKAQALGFSSDFPEEQQHAWSTAIRIYERLWPNAKLPALDETLAAIDSGKATPSRAVQAIKTVLDNLNTAFSIFDVTFRPSMETSRQLEARAVDVPIPELEALAGVPPLKLALSEAMTVAKLLAVVTINGVPQLDGNKFFERIPSVLDKVFDWAQLQTPKNLMAAIRVAHLKAPRAPKAPRVPGVPRAPKGNGPAVNDPFGIFRANTAKAAIAAALYDGQMHKMTELQNICATYGVTNGPIAHVLAELATKGKTVTKSSNKKSVSVQ